MAAFLAGATKDPLVQSVMNAKKASPGAIAGAAGIPPVPAPSKGSFAGTAPKSGVSAGAGAAAAVGGVKTPAAPGSAAPDMTIAPDYLEKAGILGTQLETMAPFNYKPQEDASYQAYEKLYADDAAAATMDTLETMGDRGIANSSITATGLAQVEQKAKNQLNALIPQLEANAYNRYETDYQNKAGLMTTYLGQGNAEKNFQVTEAGLTGKYVPADIKTGFDQLADLKAKASAKGVTAEERAQYSAAADKVRAALEAKGVDISKLGADSTLVTAQQYMGAYGTKTSAQQNTDFNQGEVKRVNDSNIANTAFQQGETTRLNDNTIDNTTFSQGETKRMNDAQISQIGQSVSNAALDGVMKQQNVDMNQWMLDNNLTPEKVSMATNGVLAKIASTGSYESAIQYVQTHASQLAADGVDVSKVYSGIAQMYPQAPAAKPEAGPDMVEINSKAISMAQADTVRWNKAKGDPIKQQAIIDEYRNQMLSGVNQGN